MKYLLLFLLFTLPLKGQSIEFILEDQFSPSLSLGYTTFQKNGIEVRTSTGINLFSKEPYLSTQLGVYDKRSARGIFTNISQSSSYGVYNDFILKDKLFTRRIRTYIFSRNDRINIALSILLTINNKS